MIPTSEHMVQMLSPYLFSLNSSASLALPSAEILLGFTSTMPWLCLPVVLSGLSCLVEVGCDVPALTRLAAGPENILMKYSEAVQIQGMLGSLTIAIAVMKITKSGRLLLVRYKP